MYHVNALEFALQNFVSQCSLVVLIGLWLLQRMFVMLFWDILWWLWLAYVVLIRVLWLLVLGETETPVLWPPHVKSWLIGKDPDAGRDWGQEEKGTTEDEMAGWHHRLDGREFEWTPGVGDEQGGLACCNSWDRRVGHDWATELKWTEMYAWVSLLYTLNYHTVNQLYSNIKQK